MRIITRAPGWAAALALAGAAVLEAPAAAQASVPGQTVVPCSSSALAAAISQANSARFAALVLSRDCTYVLTTAAAGRDGLPPVTGNLLILGSGGTTISRSPSAGLVRIFHVAAGGRLTLANLTVRNGNAGNEPGSGILDDGTLVLRNVRLTGNGDGGGSGGGLAVLDGAQATVSFSRLDDNQTVRGTGGAIENAGDLVINDSRLTGNTAADTTGGAIDNSGDLVISNSRLTGNIAIDGGGVSTQPGSTTRISGTVVARNSAIAGGGIFNQGAMVFTGDRVVSNTATLGGGGIENLAGTVTLRSTLVALNTPDNCAPQGTIPGCIN